MLHNPLQVTNACCVALSMTCASFCWRRLLQWPGIHLQRANTEQPHGPGQRWHKCARCPPLALCQLLIHMGCRTCICVLVATLKVGITIAICLQSAMCTVQQGICTLCRCMWASGRIATSSITWQALLRHGHCCKCLLRGAFAKLQVCVQGFLFAYNAATLQQVGAVHALMHAAVMLLHSSLMQ